MVVQSLTSIEIVVVDNASDEDLEAVTLEFRDNRIRYHRNPGNIGGVQNFARAASLARGEYVMTLGSDDLLLPKALEEAVSALGQHDEATAVIYRYAIVDKQGHVVGESEPLPYAGLVSGLDIRRDRRAFAFSSTCPSAILFRRRAFEALGGFDRRLEVMIDWEIYSRMLTRGGGLLFLDRVLAIFRSHGENMSAAKNYDGGFLRDILQLRSEGLAWGPIENAQLIWLDILRRRRVGKDMRQPIVLAVKHGFLAEFLAVLPLVMARYALRRLLGALGMHPRLAPAATHPDVLATWEYSSGVRADVARHVNA